MHNKAEVKWNITTSFQPEAKSPPLTGHYIAAHSLAENPPLGNQGGSPTFPNKSLLTGQRVLGVAVQKERNTLSRASG